MRLTASEFVDDSWKDLTPHKEEEQVKLDVARAFVYYPNCTASIQTQLNSSLRPIYILNNNPQTILTSPQMNPTKNSPAKSKNYQTSSYPSSDGTRTYATSKATTTYARSSS